MDASPLCCKLALRKTPRETSGKRWSSNSRKYADDMDIAGIKMPQISCILLVSLECPYVLCTTKLKLGRAVDTLLCNIPSNSMKRVYNNKTYQSMESDILIVFTR